MIQRIYSRSIKGLDIVLFFSIIPILLSGLITMINFNVSVSPNNSNYFFKHQLVWIAISIILFFAVRSIDWRFLKRSTFLFVIAYVLILLLLVFLLILDTKIKGARSWFYLKYFSFEPTDIAKIVIILILAKYFSLRHVEIANIKHIFISGIYVGIPALLTLIQPDFGSASIMFFIWFGMILVSGTNKKHLFLIIFSMLLFVAISWLFVLAPYQKLRIKTFLNPLLDPRGAGYNVLQSQISVGSGRIFGKGIGFGSQSRLNFLPEPETDFIFAAFSEEWGLIGVMFIFIFFGIFLWRIWKTALSEIRANFEKLFAIGLSFLFFFQFMINIGMNIGVLPITGLALPFMSYGGSHLVTSFAVLGIFSSFGRDG